MEEEEENVQHADDFCRRLEEKSITRSEDGERRPNREHKQVRAGTADPRIWVLNKSLDPFCPHQLELSAIDSASLR